MDNKSVVFKQHSESASPALKNGGVFAPLPLQPSLEAFAVPLPGDDDEDEGLPTSENMIERKPIYEQKELKKQHHGEQDKVRQIPEEGIKPPNYYSGVSLHSPKLIHFVSLGNLHLLGLNRGVLLRPGPSSHWCN